MKKSYKYVLVIFGVLIAIIVLELFYQSRNSDQIKIIDKEIPKVQVRYYLPVNKDVENFNKELVPAGSLILGCDDYLTLQKGGSVRSNDRADVLQSALSQTLLSKQSSGSFYYNPIASNSLINLQSIDYMDNGDLKIELKGEFDKDKCANTLEKAMIYHTVNQNFGINKTSIYLIDKQGDESCLFGNCMNE